MNCIFLRRSYPEPTPPPPSTFVITLKGTFNSSYGYVQINGTKYVADGSIVEIEAGTEVSVRVGGMYGANGATVKLNGTTVHTGNSTYTFVPTGNATITMNMTGSSYFGTYSAEITME